MAAPRKPPDSGALRGLSAAPGVFVEEQARIRLASRGSIPLSPCGSVPWVNLNDRPWIRFVRTRVETGAGKLVTPRILCEGALNSSINMLFIL